VTQTDDRSGAWESAVVSVALPYAVDHVGIAVRDLDAAVERWTGLLGARVAGVEEVAGHGVREALLELPGSGAGLQLLAATSAETPVGRFLARRGEGVHHVAYAVADLDAALARLAIAAPPVQPVAPGVTRGSGGGRVAFLPPGACGGVLVELVERSR
jgi:methylmalonyl-CoA/ethylmalonyl-CoA epimerase